MMYDMETLLRKQQGFQKVFNGIESEYIIARDDLNRTNEKVAGLEAALAQLGVDINAKEP
jgi:hypothetical protein